MGIERSILSGLGPLTGALPPTGTAPLTSQGILNLSTLGTTPVKVIGGNSANKTRRVKIVVVSAANVSWATVERGATAPTITALGAGAATEGCLIMNGSGAIEWVSIPDNLDLYLVASAASTVVNVTCVEQ